METDTERAENVGKSLQSIAVSSTSVDQQHDPKHPKVLNQFHFVLMSIHTSFRSSRFYYCSKDTATLEKVDEFWSHLWALHFLVILHLRSM